MESQYLLALLEKLGALFDGEVLKSIFFGQLECYKDTLQAYRSRPGLLPFTLKQPSMA